MARIGPNAVTRLAEALIAGYGRDEARAVFHAAGEAALLEDPPRAMIEEQVVTRLHAALRERLGGTEAAGTAAMAGRLTADYLLAHRIPSPMRWLLRALPAPLAAQALLAAIRGHAWTFAGSGTFSACRCGSDVRTRRVMEGGAVPRLRLAVSGCPLCVGSRVPEPCCDYFCGTFERLFSVLVHSRSTVVEESCAAAGAPACTFLVGW